MGDVRDLSGLDLSSLIDTVSKNPEILNLAKNMLSPPQSGTERVPDAQKSDSVPSPSELTDTLRALIPTSAKHSSHTSESNGDALLCALRPYLSKERRDTLDRILSLKKLGTVLLSVENISPSK